jgi:hypothetical protein
LNANVNRDYGLLLEVLYRRRILKNQDYRKDSPPNPNALNSFKFVPLTLSLSPLGRGRGEGELSQISKLFLRLY